MIKYILIIDNNTNIDSIVIDLNNNNFIIKNIMEQINCISGCCDPIYIENIKNINGILEIKEDGIVYAL